MYVYQFDGSPDADAPVLAERPVPTPGPGEVRIRVAAASLNYRDLLVAASAQAGKLPDGRIPLSDAAGVVDALGADVESRRLGERVMASFFLAWQDGAFFSRYMSSALGGVSSDGVLTEYVVVPATALVPIPESLNFVEAATLPCAAVTAR